MFMRRPDHDLEMATEAEISAGAGLSSVIDTLRLAQQRGVVDRGDGPVRIASRPRSAVHGVPALLIARPHFPWGDTDDLVERVLVMSLHGILAPASDAGRSVSG